jgi:hypothetical protein
VHLLLCMLPMLPSTLEKLAGLLTVTPPNQPQPYNILPGARLIEISPAAPLAPCSARLTAQLHACSASLPGPLSLSQQRSPAITQQQKQHAKFHVNIVVTTKWASAIS